MHPWTRPWLKRVFWLAWVTLVCSLIFSFGDILIACASLLVLVTVATEEWNYQRDKARLQRLIESGTLASPDWVSRLIERQSVASSGSELGELSAPRPGPSILRLWRYRASEFVLRYSRNRGMLDLLLTTDDLPPGWRQQRELRYSSGLLSTEEWDKRARRGKLVRATRIFVSSETRSRAAVAAVPWVTEEDARSALVTARRFQWASNAQTMDEAELRPPPEAGECARAWIRTTTSREGDACELTASWLEPGALVFSIVYSAPAEVEVYDLLAELIQRQRLALRGTLGTTARG